MTDNGLNVRDDLKNLSVSEIQEKAKKDLNPFAVCVLNVSGGLNISTIIRSAHNLGASEVIVLGKTKFDRRGMVGSQNYTNLIKVSALTEENEIDVNVFNRVICQEKKYWPIFIETGGTPLTHFKWKDHIRPNSPVPCLVFGNENSGIPQEIIDSQLLQCVVSIPQKGVMRSFNVSACASIVMWDLVKEMGWI